MADRLDYKHFGERLYRLFPPSYRLIDMDNKLALKRFMETANEGGFKHVIEEQNGILDLIDPHTASLEVVYFLYEQYGLNMFHGVPEEFLRSFLPNLGVAWAKKGSLDVIEYIVSSLSGIKTTTTVAYDSFDNPLVTVTLEMDFSVTEYFPDVEQFGRIVKNFIPFYCDPYFIYSYVYHDMQLLRAKDEHYMTMWEKHSENAFIPYAKGKRYAGQFNNPVFHTGRLNTPVEGREIEFNLYREFLIDPDPVFDKFIITDEDSGIINSQWSNMYFNSRHNDPGYWSNLNFLYSDFLPTDGVKDFIISAPAYDNGEIEASDPRMDHLEILPETDSVILAHPDVFVMNKSLTNSGKKYCILEADEIVETKVIIEVKEDAFMDSTLTPYIRPVLNAGDVFNTGITYNQTRYTDEESMHVTSTVLSDSSDLSYEEVRKDHISEVLHDTGYLLMHGVMKKTNDSTYGVTRPSTDITHYGGEQGDVFEDLFLTMYKESCGVSNEPESSLSNTGTGFNDFTFNGYSAFDIVWSGGVRNTLFS